MIQWRPAMRRCLHRLRIWSDKHEDWLFASAGVILLRMWYAALGTYAVLTSPNWNPGTEESLYHGLGPISTDGFGVFLAPWQRWDAIWYQRIASMGYSPDDASGSFFPLFPVLMRAVGTALDGNLILAGMVICTIAMLFAFVLLYRLSAKVGDSDTAKRAVIYWAIFPTSFYLFGGYAESVLAVCALAAIYFARRKNWWGAGIAAGATTLSRPVGFLVVIPAIIEAMQQSSAWRSRVRILFPVLLGVTLAMGAWMLYLQLAFKDAMLWVHAEEAWNRVFVIPGQTILLTIQYILGDRPQLGNNILDLTLTTIVLGAIIAGARKLPLSYTAYALAMLIIPLSSYALAGPWQAMPMAAGARRAILAIPAFIVLGKLVRGRWLQPTWITISLGFQALCFVEFARWMWID